MPGATDPSAALPRIPRLVARWVGAGLVTLVVTSGWRAPLASWTGASPADVWVATVVLALGISAAATTRTARHAAEAWLGPFVPLAVFGASTVGLLLAGAAAAALAVRRAPFPVDRLGLLWAGLAALAAGGLVPAVILSWVPPDTPGILDLGAALLLVGPAAAFVAVAWRHDHPTGPSAWTWLRLPATLRPEVRRAARLVDAAVPLAPDVATRRGLVEVAGWVVRLQRTRARIDRIRARALPLPDAAAPPEGNDAWSRERARAASRHLQRAREHREALEAEARRASALAGYALAWLEDARGGLEVARLCPDVSPPPDLDHVLDRLRTHAVDRAAHRRTGRELAAVSPG